MEQYYDIKHLLLLLCGERSCPFLCEANGSKIQKVLTSALLRAVHFSFSSWRGTGRHSGGHDHGRDVQSWLGFVHIFLMSSRSLQMYFENALETNPMRQSHRASRRKSTVVAPDFDEDMMTVSRNFAGIDRRQKAEVEVVLLCATHSHTFLQLVHIVAGCGHFPVFLILKSPRSCARCEICL